MGDRTHYVPSHMGENVLPNLPFFHKLLRYAQRRPPRLSIRDVNAGLEKTFHQVLSDALALRNELAKTLNPQALRDLQDDKEVYIGLLAPGGYEYTVGFVAILALGAAVVPMGKSLITLSSRHKANNMQLLGCPLMKPHIFFSSQNAWQ